MSGSTCLHLCVYVCVCVCVCVSVSMCSHACACVHRSKPSCCPQSAQTPALGRQACVCLRMRLVFGGWGGAGAASQHGYEYASCANPPPPLSPRSLSSSSPCTSNIITKQPPLLWPYQHTARCICRRLTRHQPELLGKGDEKHQPDHDSQ